MHFYGYVLQTWNPGLLEYQESRAAKDSRLEASGLASHGRPPIPTKALQALLSYPIIKGETEAQKAMVACIKSQCKL